MSKIYVNGKEVEPIQKVKLGEELKKSINEIIKESPNWKNKLKKESEIESKQG